MSWTVCEPWVPYGTNNKIAEGPTHRVLLTGAGEDETKE